MALTRITKGVIKPNENYDTHNINSTGIVTAIGANFTGNVSVGGTLTYEDVTSIDSVGIITAQNGIDCNGDLDVDGHTNLDNVSISGITTTGDITIEDASPRLQFLDTNADADEKKWDFKCNPDSKFVIQAINDSGSGGGSLFRFTRTGNNVDTFEAQKSGTIWLTISNENRKLTTRDLDVTNNLDVDGHTNLDNVSIAGVTTASDNISIVKSSGPILELTTNTNGADSSLRLHEGTAGSTSNGGGMYYSGANNKLYITCGTTLTTERITIDRDTGNVAVAKDLDVDGHTNLDNVSIAGITTISNSLIVNDNLVVGNSSNDNFTINAKIDSSLIPSSNNTKDLGSSSSQWRDLYVDGHTNLDNVNIAGVTTFTGAIDANDNLTTNGTLRISSAAPILRFTETDNSKNFFIVGDSNSLSVRMDNTGGGNIIQKWNSNGTHSFYNKVFFNGDIDVDGHTNLDNVSISGVSTFSGNIDANGDLDVDGQTHLDGSVGINQTNPYYKLHLNFTDNTTSLSGGTGGNWGGNGIRIENDSTTAGAMALAHFRVYSADWHIGNKYVSTSPDKSDFVFLHEATETLRIAHNGLMGLGVSPTSHNNTTAFQIYDDYNSQGYPRIRLTNQSTGTTSADGYEISLDGSNLHALHRQRENADIYFMTNNVERLRITSGGDVGINTTTPQNGAHFQHYQSANRHQSFQSTNGDLAIVTDNNSNPGVYIKGTGTADLIEAIDNTTTVFRVKDGGHTQITGKLSVNSTSITSHNANFYGGNTDTGGVRIELAHTTTTISGNTATSFFPHHLQLSNYSKQSVADDGLITIGFDIPTTSNHANGVIAYQATAPGTGDFQFWTESGNTIYERLRITSAGIIGVNKNNPNLGGGGNGIHIASSGVAELHLTGSQGSASTDGLQIQMNGNIANIINRETGPIKFYTGGASSGNERLRIGSTGALNYYLGSQNSDNFQINGHASQGRTTFAVKAGNASSGSITSMRLLRSNDANPVSIFIDHSSNNFQMMNSVDAGDFILHLMKSGSGSSLPKFRVNNDGKTSLGDSPTGSPQATLHVRNSGDVSSTLGGAPASIMIEATTGANWSGGEAGAELLFKKGGDITGAIRNEHDRTPGDHSYEDAGLAFYTAPAAESPTATKKFVIRSTGDVDIIDGNLSFANGHGISFAATGDGSGTDSSEKLDDYEEGTWTPTANYGASGITVYAARYTKIGNKVFIDFRGYLTGTNGNSVQIGGLPYANLGSDAHNIGPIMHNGFDYGGSTEPVATSYITGTNSYFQMYYSQTNSNGWTSVTGNNTNGEQFITSLTYFTS